MNFVTKYAIGMKVRPIARTRALQQAALAGRPPKAFMVGYIEISLKADHPILIRYRSISNYRWYNEEHLELA